MSKSIQRACAWSGPVAVVFWLVGFWVFAGLIPPPSPEDSAKEIAGLYRDDTNWLRFGLALTLIGSALLGAFVAAISVQLKRIEGSRSPMTYLQLAFGALLVLEFVYPVMMMGAAAYRPDRSEDIVQAINDVAWMLFVGVVSTFCVQLIAIGVCILSDQRSHPIFPRWVGYFHLLVAGTFVAGDFLMFFKTGPVAWNGLFSWWIPVATFGAWLFVMAVYLVKAINRDDDAGEAPVEILSRGELQRLVEQLVAAELAAHRPDVAPTLRP